LHISPWTVRKIAEALYNKGYIYYPRAYGNYYDGPIDINSKI